MGRIIAIDYGLKRTGLAATDPGKIIATGLTTVESSQVIPFLKKYLLTEQVELFLLGEPKNLNATDTHATPLVNRFLVELQKNFPDIEVKRIDERFTSKMAVRTMIDSGLKKKARQNKALVDEIAATIMLQGYLHQL